MIVASRRLPTSTRNKLPSKLKLNSLVSSSSNHPILMATTASLPQQSSSSLCTETSPPSQPSLSSKPYSSSPISTGEDWGNNIFTGETKTRTIDLLTTDRESCLQNSFFQTFEDMKKAAVLVPFCFDSNGRPGILYNLRSKNLNAHRGEISFPGGTLEPQDNDDPIAAALRETREELGIEADEVEVWTTCRVFSTISTQIGVVPVVGFIKSGPIEPKDLNINPDEVDHAFILTLDYLCNSSNHDYRFPPKNVYDGGKGANRTRTKTNISLPVWKNLEEANDKLDGMKLWGLTAFITHLVLSAFTPEKYNRKVSFIKLMLKDKDKRNSVNDKESKSLKESTVDNPNSTSKL